MLLLQTPGQQRRGRAGRGPVRGRNPGDPKSTDPNADLVIQPYTSRTPSGGFLFVKLVPEGSPWKTARAIFEMRDENGDILYSTSVDANKN